MSNDRHVSNVQPRKKSEITQSGREPPSTISCRRVSNCGFICLVAVTKGTHESIEGRSAVFSQPSGRSGTYGNGTTETVMDVWFESLEWMNGAFSGVVTMVTFRPRFESSLDMSSNGMVWP